MKKLAFFDFCETLVNFQTADAFIDYVREKEGRFYMRIVNTASILLSKFRIISVLNKLFPLARLGKKIKLLQLKGIGIESLENHAGLFYREKIMPELIVPVIDELKNLMKNGYEIAVVSAGYSIYLKYFAKEYKIKYNISTEIAFDKTGKWCRGTISGQDCIGVEKLNRINASFAGQEIDLNESISYSDSITDLPMLLLAGKGIVVSQSNSQPWALKYKFQEIIWHRK